MEKARPTKLNILNLETATFKCVFPICGGACCKDGEPGVEPAEIAKIEANLEKFRPHLRPAAQEYLRHNYFMSDKIKAGRRSLPVVEDWCVFFNEGCILHKVGAVEGDKFAYKPWLCVTFPLERNSGEDWHIAQWGQYDEDWQIFCLNPAETALKGAETLQDEIAFAEGIVDGKEAWRGIKPLPPNPPVEPQ